MSHVTAGKKSETPVNKTPTVSPLKSTAPTVTPALRAS